MIRVANAPCSWGVIEFDSSSERAGFARVLDEMRASGYDGTELGDWGFMPTDPAELRREVAARNLELLGAFVPVALASESSHAEGIDVAVRTAGLMRDAGAKDAFVVLSDANGTVPRREQNAGRITHGDGMSAGQWTAFAHGAEKIAAAVRDRTGLRTVFHPHCGGYIEAPWEVDELMARCDDSLVGLVLDTGHATFGGGDPIALFEKHARRVWHVHFKDCDPRVAEQARAEGVGYLAAVRRQLFCELGQGAVDFSSVLAALTRASYDGWIVVEQDVFPGYGTPLDSARRNRAYLRRLGV
jgi:inosose dehydratase